MLFCSKSVLLIFFLENAIGSTLLDPKWHAWKARHGVVYQDWKEESQKRKVWEDNYKTIAEHNRGNYTYELGLNRFADLTNEEFEKIFLRPLPTDVKRDGEIADEHVLSGTVSYPYRLDWREKGLVSHVKDQGYCASSWAFSAAGAVEGQFFKNKDKGEPLSEQQLIDCSWSYGNAGCNGGHMIYSFRYIMDNDGICKEHSYPYLGYIWHCMSKFCTVSGSVKGYTRVAGGSEGNLLDALYTIGPISVAVDGSGNTFQFYTSGVYGNTQCSSKKLNHALLLVGYGTTIDGQDYWIVKNSWGPGWGISGYMKLARNQNNMCGIATAASYPKS